MVAREAQEKASRTAWARADISIKRNGTSMKLRNKKTGNIGDYLTQEQLRDSMKDALEQIISRLNKLKEDK